MKKFKNHQRPRRKYRFDIIGHKKALKIWWDSPFKGSKSSFSFHQKCPDLFLPKVAETYDNNDLWYADLGEFASERTSNLNNFLVATLS
jgi:hypothetical protein